MRPMILLATTCIAVAVIASPTASAAPAWYGPADIMAGDLVRLVRLDAEGYADGTPAGHVDAEINVYLDDILLFSSAEVHEHDAIYEMVISPPRAGTLIIQDEHAAASFMVHPATSAGIAKPTIAVADGEWSLQNDAEGDRGMQWLVDMHHADGTLRASQSITSTGQKTIKTEPNTPIGMGAWVAGRPSGAGAPDHRFVTAEQAQGPTIIGIDNALVPPCIDTAPVLAVDPEPGAGPQPIWQAGSNIRFTLLDADAGSHELTIIDDEITRPNSLFFHNVVATGQYPSILINLDQAGHYRAYAGDTCFIPFTVVPAGPATGTVEADIQTGPGVIEATLAAVNDDGSIIGHYEFETRVARAEAGDDTRLVWAGKLHGHDGTANFRLEDLPAGTYTLTTHASPQGRPDPTIAPRDGGYQWTIEVTAPSRTAGDSQTDGEATPGLALLGIMGALGLAAALRRRP